jgi:hypothetical protein
MRRRRLLIGMLWALAAFTGVAATGGRLAAQETAPIDLACGRGSES